MEQNTDRMWWTIGAVLLGGILIAGFFYFQQMKEEYLKAQKKEEKDQKLVDWIKSYYPNLSKEDIQDIITESKNLLLQKISKDLI